MVNLLGQFSGDVVNRQEKPPFFSLQKIQALVRGNAVNPGKELCVFAEAVDVAIDFDEHFLGEVVCIIMVNYHFPDVVVHPFLVGTHQKVETVVPRYRVSDFLKQFLVGQAAGVVVKTRKLDILSGIKFKRPAAFLLIYFNSMWPERP